MEQIKKITKSKLKKMIREGVYGGSIAPPKDSGDSPNLNSAPRAFLMSPEGVEEMKRQLEPEIIQVFKNMQIDKSNAYEILALVLRDLENQLGEFDYEYEETPENNPSLNESKKHPVRLRVRSSKRAKE
jgi:hypothetical protein